jgi:23S rRNA (uracil1939-C5)-methyltransferase
MGKNNLLLYGNNTISDFIGKYKFEISPNSFFQANPIQTEVLYGKALEYAGLTGNETVVDIYCGIGTISLFLAEKAKYVYGIEVVEQAVEDAKRNAEANGIKNVEFIAGEAEKLIPELYERGIYADVVVIDPPRKGCEERVLQAIVNMGAQLVVYVSCNPGTLARDLKWLAERGYEVAEVQPVDMFPQTVHTESVVKLERRKTQ